MCIFIFLYLEILLFSTLLYILNSAYYKSSSRRALLDDVHRDCVYSAVTYSCTESDEYNSNNLANYQILTNGSKADFLLLSGTTVTFIKSTQTSSYKAIQFVIYFILLYYRFKCDYYGFNNEYHCSYIIAKHPQMAK